MKRHNIRHQYVKPGHVEFYVELRGVKVILLTAKFQTFNDMPKLYKLAAEELTTINSVLDRVAA